MSLDCDFNRENDGMVWARVDFGFGLSVVVESNEPNGCREWRIEEFEVLTDRATISGTLVRRANPLVPYDSDLGRALAKAFDEFVRRESALLSSTGRPT